MKKLICLAAAGLLLNTASAQLYVGTAGNMTVKAGTLLAADSLVLIPATDLLLNNNSLTHSYTAVPGLVSGAGINRVYSFSSPFDFTGTAGLFYADAELNGNAAATLELAHNSSGSWTTTTGSTPGSNYISNSVTASSLMQITAVASGTALPLVVISFSASAAGSLARLNWQVTEAGSFSLFEIEQSTDGTHFSNKGTVMPAEGQLYYCFYDETPDQGINYYRLNMHIHDGSSQFTQVRTLTFGKNPEMDLTYSPQPAANVLHISLSKEPDPQSMITVTAISGDVAYTASCTQKNFDLDLQTLSAGIYILSYFNGQTIRNYKIEKR